MKVLELKQTLNRAPDDAEIILGANGHWNTCDSVAHGDTEASLVEVHDETKIFAISATGWKRGIRNLNLKGLKIIIEDLRATS